MPSANYVEDSPEAVKVGNWVIRPGLFFPKRSSGIFRVIRITRFFQDEEGCWRARAVTAQGFRLTPKATTIAKSYVRQKDGV